MINNLSQLKSHPQQKIKGKDKGREMQIQGQHSDVLSKSQFKITSTVENKRQRQGKRDANTRTTQRCVIEEETEALGIKPLHRPPSGK